MVLMLHNCCWSPNVHAATTPMKSLLLLLLLWSHHRT
jgi:hypothetical protein